MDTISVAAPEPSSEPNISHSLNTVDVRVIDTNTLLYLNPNSFWQPSLPGFNGLDAPVYCFLISHGDHHVVFDLGVRTDWENYPPKIVSLIKATTTITGGQDVASILDSSSDLTRIRSCDIDAVIWSYNHFDHIGNISTFPSTTDLVVGPGVTAASWPGRPQNPDGIVLDSDRRNRNVREIAFTGNLKIGRFEAFDYFGDGSFYLLDAPGHATGHLCGLARTAPSPNASFVPMGADVCHHPGTLRPTEYLPLPRCIPLPQEAGSSEPSTHFCPGEMLLLQRLTLDNSPHQPFFKVADGPLFPDHDAALDTVRKVQELDASDNMFIIIGHDRSIRDKIPLFPESINGWKEKNLSVETRWLFCEDFQQALKEKGEMLEVQAQTEQ